MINSAENWFTISNVHQLDTPVLVVYPDRVTNNIELLKGMINRVDRLRPHVKTPKCTEAVLAMQSAGIHKFKCATIAEAEMLGMCKAADVLLAYQPVGPKVGRLIRLIQTYPFTRFSCLVDNYFSASAIAAAALYDGLCINVFLDVNAGMNRSGIRPGEQALQLYIDCSNMPGIKINGLHIYDGHIHDADLSVRTMRCDEAFEPVETLNEQLKAKGFEPVIIAGGTPTFTVHARRENVECSPGTFIYWDAGYGTAFTEQPFLPAALLVTRIVSLPGENLICTDLGHKSVAAENILGKRVVFLNTSALTPVSQSEEHLVLDAGPAHSYKTGDILYGIPYHICPTVPLYERVITIKNTTISGEWLNIARDRRIII